MFIKFKHILFLVTMFSETAAKDVPEHILERLQNIKDFSTFYQEFMLRDFITETFENNRERNFADTTEVMLENQECKPRPVVVEVPQPLESYTFHYPYFVEVFRCYGGCGATQFITTCAGKEREIVRAKVVSLSWLNDKHGNPIPPKLTHVELMNETQCQCACRYDSTACNRFQYWDEQSCRCRCSNWGCPNHFSPRPIICCECVKAQKCSKKHIWDQRDCACVCRRRNKPCRSPLKIRDKQTCRCVCPPMLMCRHGYRLNKKSCECEDVVTTNA